MPRKNLLPAREIHELRKDVLKTEIGSAKSVSDLLKHFKNALNTCDQNSMMSILQVIMKQYDKITKDEDDKYHQKTLLEFTRVPSHSTQFLEKGIAITCILDKIIVRLEDFDQYMSLLNEIQQSAKKASSSHYPQDDYIYYTASKAIAFVESALHANKLYEWTHRQSQLDTTNVKRIVQRILPIIIEKSSDKSEIYDAGFDQHADEQTQLTALRKYRELTS